MSGDDDPNKGFAGELILGSMLLESSRGRFADPAFGLGLRFTWEYGRILDTEPLRETLWADVRWMMAGSQRRAPRSSTAARASTTSRWRPPTSSSSAQRRLTASSARCGGGFAFQTTSLTVGEELTAVKGLKPLLQYGVGFRGRPRLSEKMASPSAWS